MLREVIVKQLTTTEELQELQQLDKEIWEADALPTDQTLGAVRNGGVVLGAYYKDALIGFSYSYPGFVNGEIYLTLHKLGVKQVYREQGVAELLQHTLIVEARELGYKAIKGVIEPLSASLANLSFTKLGAFSYTYYNNYYSELSDYFNSKELPSDRLIIELLPEQREASSAIAELIEEAVPVVEWSLTPAGLPMLGTFNADIRYGEAAYKLAIPTHFHKLKVESIALAEDWRYKMRAILTTLFAQDYVIVAVQKGAEHVHEYIIVKRALVVL